MSRMASASSRFGDGAEIARVIADTSKLIAVDHVLTARSGVRYRMTRVKIRPQSSDQSSPRRRPSRRLLARSRSRVAYLSVEKKPRDRCDGARLVAQRRCEPCGAVLCGKVLPIPQKKADARPIKIGA